MIKRIIAAGLLLFGMFGYGLLGSSAVYAQNPPAPANPCHRGTFLGFPRWYDGLKCEVKNGQAVIDMEGNINGVWIIALNVIQWIVITAGYAAVGFIIWGGFRFIIGRGEPEKIVAARKTILNAIVGLVIVLAATAIIRTVQAGLAQGTLL